MSVNRSAILASLCNFEQTGRSCSGKVGPMLATFYLHKVDQCARLAEAATEPCDQSRYVSERQEWLRILAREIGANVVTLEATIARLPME